MDILGSMDPLRWHSVCIVFRGLLHPMDSLDPINPVLHTLAGRCPARGESMAKSYNRYTGYTGSNEYTRLDPMDGLDPIDTLNSMHTLDPLDTYWNHWIHWNHWMDCIHWTHLS